MVGAKFDGCSISLWGTAVCSQKPSLKLSTNWWCIYHSINFWQSLSEAHHKVVVWELIAEF